MLASDITYYGKIKSIILSFTLKNNRFINVCYSTILSYFAQICMSH